MLNLLLLGTQNALVCAVYEEGEFRLVNVPNILLQKYGNIRVYGFSVDHTRHLVAFKVIARPRPEDYVYTETEVKRWDDVVARAEEMLNDVGITSGEGEHSLLQLGSNNQSTGDFAVALGQDNEASGKQSHATGYGNKASGVAASAGGSQTKAKGAASSTKGILTEATGKASAAKGYKTKAVGDYSIAKGVESEAEGVAATARGGKTKAKGDYSTAEGNQTKAEGIAAHSEGSGTKAGGGYSHAEGQSTEVMSGATASHTEGKGTKAGSKYQHVQGKHNIVDDKDEYADIVGNGEDDEHRSNAYTLDWEGNARFKGDIYVGGTQKGDEKLKKVATEKDLEPIKNDLKKAGEAFSEAEKAFGEAIDELDDTKKAVDNTGNIFANALKGKVAGTSVVAIDGLSEVEHTIKLSFPATSGVSKIVLSGDRNILDLGRSQANYCTKNPDNTITTGNGGCLYFYNIEGHSTKYLVDILQELDGCDVTFSVNLDTLDYTYMSIGIGYTNGTAVEKSDSGHKTQCTIRLNHKGRTINNVVLYFPKAGLSSNIVVRDIQMIVGGDKMAYTPFTWVDMCDVTNKIKSVSPSMVIALNKPDVAMSVEYNRDINKAWAVLEQRIAALST